MNVIGFQAKFHKRYSWKLKTFVLHFSLALLAKSIRAFDARGAMVFKGYFNSQNSDLNKQVKYCRLLILNFVLC